jgi:hypothetical protein
MASGSVQIMMWLSNVFCGTGYRAHLPSQLKARQSFS